MGYFPFFIELSGKDGLIAGGGRVALQKLEKLLPYGPRLTVAAPEIIPEISALQEIRLVRRGFSEDLLEDRFFCCSGDGRPRAEPQDIRTVPRAGHSRQCG